MIHAESLQERAEEREQACTSECKEMQAWSICQPVEVHVDHITPMPREGDTAFLLVRKRGEKYITLDTMVLKDGAPIHARPANDIYLPVLSKLE